MKKILNKGLAWAMTVCMVLAMLPMSALAAAPAAPTNLRIEVGDLYQTMPVLTWNVVEDAFNYDIACLKDASSDTTTGGTTWNYYPLSADTTGTHTYSNFKVTANNEDGSSEEATLSDATMQVNNDASKTTTAIHNTAIWGDTNYQLYTITGLPANTTCRLDYKFYDPAKNDGIAYAENAKEECEKKYTNGSQNYEINANGVLVIGIESVNNDGEHEDWNGLADGVVNSACDEYSLTVVNSSSISADGKTVNITQQKFTLSFAEYSGQTTSTQSVSFAQNRVDNIEFGTPYTQTATHTTGDGSLVYYSMYASIKKVNPTSGEVVGWYRNEDDYSGRITAFAAATENYPATLSIYNINFVQLSDAPTNIHLGFQDGNTNPVLKWTPSGDTWTSCETTYFDDNGNHIAVINGGAESGENSTYLHRASFGKTGAQAETHTFSKAEVTMTGNGTTSATASQDLSFTSTQTVSSTPLTAVYSGTSAETDYGTCAHFTVSEVPANKSMEVIYRCPTTIDSPDTEWDDREYDRTVTTNTYHLSGSDGSYSFFDPVVADYSNGVLSLSDLDIDAGDYYYLTVYDGTVTDDTTGNVNITIYPLDFVFDSRAAQDMSWSSAGPLNITYGDTDTGLTAVNNTTPEGAITYSSSDESVATVDTDGKITTVGAGECTVTATAAETGTAPTDYRATSISYTLTVGKKAVTVIASNASRKFGEANPTFSIADPSGVLVSGDTDTDLGVTLSTTATTTSNVETYSITGTSTSANYNVTVTAGTLTVSKADAPTVSGINKNLLYSAAHTDVTVNIAALPADRGMTSYVPGTVTGDTEIINGTVANTATGISFSTNSGTENQTATIPVTVTMQNYADATVNVVVKLVDKTPVTITGVTVANKTYDGAAVSYNGTPANEQGYTDAYEYIWSGGSAPKNAGSYTLTVKIPDDNADFMGEVEIPFEISRKAITAKPQNISIYNGAALPTAFTLEYSGLVSGDTITPAGMPEFALKNGTDLLANSNTNGTYTIEWTNKDAVTVEHINYTVTKADGTLTISTQPSYNGGGGSSTPATPAPTVSGATATTTTTAKTGSDGKATASVTQLQMSTAITTAQKAAASTGEAPHVEIQVSGASGASTVETTLPKTAVQALVTGKMETLTLSSNVADITFDAQAIAAIAGAASGDVNISAAQVENSTLSDAAAQVVGNRPVYSFSVTSGGSTISQFGGAVTVSVPYTPAAGEDTDAIVAYYINANGEPELMQNCHYDAKSGTLVFTTTHFSTYAVGYNKIVFSDVSDSAWYADAVSYLAARGITGGTTETTFSPNATLTRGQFITLVLRAYGIEPDENPTDNFSDAGDTYYTGYLAAAKRLGISNGVGDNKFAPEQAVTRQDMFTMLYNALKAIDQLPEDDSGKTLSDFTDSKSISSYAQAAMAYLVENGIVGGSNGQLTPTDTTTRAQMAQVLYNLLSN